MVVCRKPLILVTDLIGAAATAALMAAVVYLSATAYLSQQTELPELRARVTATRERRKAISAENTTLVNEIRERERTLRERSGSAPTDVSNILESISQQCTRFDIALLQFQPAAPVRHDRYSSWDVRVSARGRFPDFQHMLSRFESESRYMHVREIDIASLSSAASPLCRLNWTVRVNLPTPSTGAAP